MVVQQIGYINIFVSATLVSQNIVNYWTNLQLYGGNEWKQKHFTTFLSETLFVLGDEDGDGDNLTNCFVPSKLDRQLTVMLDYVNPGHPSSFQRLNGLVYWNRRPGKQGNHQLLYPNLPSFPSYFYNVLKKHENVGMASHEREFLCRIE